VEDGVKALLSGCSEEVSDELAFLSHHKVLHGEEFKELDFRTFELCVEEVTGFIDGEGDVKIAADLFAVCRVRKAVDAKVQTQHPERFDAGLGVDSRYEMGL